EPKHLTTSEGLPITSFRLASTQRRYDRAKQSWVDGDTNWYTVTAFRRLASNSAGSTEKGQRVIVTGSLRLREWENGERRGINVEVVADSLGHDLSWGRSSFTRNAVLVSTPDGGTAEAFPESVDGVGDATIDGAGQAEASPGDERQPVLVPAAD